MIIQETSTKQETLSPTSDIDLDEYFQRIGYLGDLQPTLATLKALHQSHTLAIPFENLNPLIKLPVRLDIQSLQQKLLRKGRGGFCFEQNILFAQVLKTLGFKVKGLAARVLWNLPAGITPARGHMLLSVEVDEQTFIADVGFGGLTLTGPLQLIEDIEQPTPHEPFRLTKVEDEFTLQAKIRNEWKSLYRFGLQEQLLPDYEVTSWYLCNHPDSHFTKELIVAKPFPEGRYTLRNNDFAIHYLNGDTDRRSITSASELRKILEDVFGITLPAELELDVVLQRLAQPEDFR